MSVDLSMPLFLDPPTFEKEAEFKLGPNVKNWDEEIIKHVHEELPYLGKLDFSVNFKEMDEELGYAKGGIKLNIQDLKATVPLIVRKRRLAPLDVLMIGEEKIVPLNEENLLSLIQKHQPAGQLKKVQREGVVENYLQNQTAHDQMFPPNHGKYSYASIGDKIPNAFRDDMEMLHETLQNDANARAGFEINHTVPSLAKFASLETKDPDDSEFSITKVSGKVLDDIDLGFEKLAKLGGAIVVDQKTGAHQGLFMPEVETFEGEKLGMSLFVGNDGTYGYQQMMAGKPSQIDMSATSDFEIGDEISFVKTAGIAMEPIQVLSKSRTPDGEKIAARTHDGSTVRIHLTDHISDLQKVAGYFVVPKSYGIVKLGKRIFPLQDDDYIQKLAMARMSPNMTHVRCIGRNFSFDNEKIGSAHGCFEKEIIEKLSPYYSNAEELVKTAEKRGSIVVSGIPDIEKIARVKIPAQAQLGWNDRVKIASSLSDPDSVDAILGLGFLNEENVQYFVSLLPAFEECINNIAKTLVAIRLGLKADEGAAKMAMKYLQRTVDSLKGLGFHAGG